MLNLVSIYGANREEEEKEGFLKEYEPLIKKKSKI